MDNVTKKLKQKASTSQSDSSKTKTVKATKSGTQLRKEPKERGKIKKEVDKSDEASHELELVPSSKKRRLQAGPAKKSEKTKSVKQPKGQAKVRRKVDKSDEANHELEGEPSSKKRKLQTAHVKKPEKTKSVKQSNRQARIRKRVDKSDEASHELDGEPSSKKRKLKTDHVKKSEKTKTLKTENKVKKLATCKWKDDEYLAESESINILTARNVINLFKEDNTIPFIARYRSHLTGHLTPDKLRQVKATYDYIQSVHKKAENLVKIIPENELKPELISYIESARTLEELEFIGSHFKKDSKKSLAHRAKELGLEPWAKKLLEGTEHVTLFFLVDTAVPGLEDENKVKLGIQHIIADIISKNTEVHDLLEEIFSSDQVLLKSKFSTGMSDQDISQSKYGLYGSFSQPVTSIKSHQTLAINRGEAENELSVKIFIPNFMWNKLKAYCNNTWLRSGNQYSLRSLIFHDSVDDAIKRLLEPLAARRIRAKLKSEAESEALGVFAMNLRQLLMTPPCTGRVVMGIDPGFGNGCKVAVVSRTGEPIAYDNFFLKKPAAASQKLVSLIYDHGCEIIALGNGMGCRETEVLLAALIKRQILPSKLSYTIINEQGVSIYSCSAAAAEEFPNVDPKVVGAVSLARRLQNPLSELVKVEPKHLGVGMYQHDVEQKRLESTLDEVVSECVSFVGVDINSASVHLLKRVAGLNASKAQEIIKYRTEVCTFKSREDLMNVKGIKTKTFQQCGGFIRIIPATARCTKHSFCQKEFNPLDETCIHPESYKIALKIIRQCNLKLERLGFEDFVNAMKDERKWISAEVLAKRYNCSTLEIELIIDSLTTAKDFDLRSISPGPIFRSEIVNLEDLVLGQVLEGVIRNVVNFGAFVDIGVGQNGLIHTSQMGDNTVRLNDRVRVQVISTGLNHEKIGLKLLTVIR